MRKIMGYVMVAVFCLVGGQAKAQDEAKFDFLEVFSGSMGGSWYAVGSEIAAVLQAEIPGLTTRVAPGGGSANPSIVQKKQGYLGLVYTGTGYEAFSGVADYNEPHSELRHVISLYSMPFLWIALRNDDRINSVSDLGNKRISPGRTGQTGLVIARESLAAHGINMDEITSNGGTVSLLGDSERLNMLRDRNLDVASGMLPLDHSELQSLSISPGIKLVTMDPEKIPLLQARIPGLADITIPPKRFDAHQTEDIHTVASVTALICHADLPDDLVYDIVKALVENHEKFNKYFDANENVMNAPLTAMVEGFPVHPGALRYFKEKGLVK